MALNRPEYFDISKHNDKLIVDYAKQHSRKAYLYDGINDMKDKMDIALQFKDGKTYNVDTKYVNANENHLYYEFEKHAENSTSKTDWLLYCLRNTDYRRCWFVRRSALNELTNDDTKSSTKEFLIVTDISNKQSYPIKMEFQNKTPDAGMYKLTINRLKRMKCENSFEKENKNLKNKIKILES